MGSDPVGDLGWVGSRSEWGFHLAAQENSTADGPGWQPRFSKHQAPLPFISSPFPFKEAPWLQPTHSNSWSSLGDTADHLPSTPNTPPILTSSYTEGHV